MNSPFNHDLYPILPGYELRESCRATRRAGKREPTPRRTGRGGDPGVGGVRGHAADLRAPRITAEQNTRGQHQYRRSAASHPELQSACFTKRTCQARSRHHLSLRYIGSHRQSSMSCKADGSDDSGSIPLALARPPRSQGMPGRSESEPSSQIAAATARARKLDGITVRSSPARST